MGLHASDTTELVLEDVEVADEQRLGEIDQGFFDTLRILDKGRIGIGAWSIGIGRAAFEAARRYAKERVQFDKPIAEFQADPAHAGRHGDRAGRRAPAGLAGGVDAGPGAEDHRGVVDRQVLRRARHHARLQRGGADSRRLRLHARVRRRALPARRQAGRDRRGDQRGPEDGHRARAARTEAARSVARTASSKIAGGRPGRGRRR